MRIVSDGDAWWGQVTPFPLSSEQTLLIGVAVCAGLIRLFGSVGAAIGVLIIYALVSFARVYLVYRLYHLHPFGHLLLRPLIDAAIVFAVFYGLNRVIHVDTLVELILALVLLTGFYLTLYFWGPKEPEETDLLKTVRKKLARNSQVDR